MIKSFRRFTCHALFGALLLPGLAVAGNSYNAYVPNFTDNTVSIINTGTNTVTATVAVLGTFPEGVAVSPDGTKVLLTLRAGTSAGDIDDGVVEILDTATNAVIAQIPTLPGPVGVVVAPDNSKAYVVNNNFNATANLLQIDLTSYSITNSIAINSAGEGPFTLAISPDGTQLYVTSNAGPGGGPGLFQVVNLASSAVTTALTLGDDPSGTAVTPNGAQVYVTNSDDGTVSVISTATAAITATINVGNTPFGLAPSPGGSQMWVANTGDGTISVIDTATNTVVSTIQGIDNANSVGFTPDGVTAYVPNGGTGDGNSTVSVIDVASQALTDTITVGNSPIGLGNFVGTAPAAPPPPSIVSAVLPSARSVAVGDTATIFATILNATAAPLTNCQIGLGSSAPSGLTLAYQTTDPTTNAPTGEPNTPATIPANGAQTFVLSFTSEVAFDAPGLPLVYSCDGVAQALATTGVNTIDLLFSATPIPDIIALEATVSPGVLEVPFSLNESAAFAVATDNVGVDGTLTVSADTGGATLPLTISICQTNPTSGACLSDPAPTVTLDFTAGGTPTFSLFVTASADIPFNPGDSRIFVRFLDSSATSHGATSVAVETD